VVALVGLEGIAIPVPGETALIAAAIVAGSKHELDIVLVILAALGGAVAGDNLGFWIGRLLGTRLLLRYGRRVGLDDSRLKLGHYLFRHYGGALVGFGRFVAVLRTLAPFLAGANRMPWPRFFVFNLGGGALWSIAIGAGAYALGEAIDQLMGPVGLVLLAIAVIGLAIGFRQLRRHQARLQAAAEREFPGPLA
jgi:membrane protein DedA with SNARE-associated domain